MVKVEIKNAVVSDDGYGLTVNGTALASIISTALGVKVGDKRACFADNNLSEFESNCCDVTVILDPQPTSTHIENNEDVWGSVEEMEDTMYEQFKKKNAKTDQEE